MKMEVCASVWTTFVKFRIKIFVRLAANNTSFVMENSESFAYLERKWRLCFCFFMNIHVLLRKLYKNQLFQTTICLVFLTRWYEFCCLNLIYVIFQKAFQNRKLSRESIFFIEYQQVTQSSRTKFKSQKQIQLLYSFKANFKLFSVCFDFFFAQFITMS